MRQNAAVYIIFLLLQSSILFAFGTADVRMDVPWYGQEQHSWAEKALGDSPSLTIGSHGCAVTASAMVMKYHGIRTNPGMLNRSLLKSGAYEKGWDDTDGTYLGAVRLNWSKAVSGQKQLDGFVSHNYKNTAADLPLIRSYLDKKIPVIAEVVRPGGIPHFIVLTGYSGDDFYIRDPLDQSVKRLSRAYNVSDSYGSGAARNILGIRVFLPAD